MSVSFFVDDYQTLPGSKPNPYFPNETYEEWQARGGPDEKPDHLEMDLSNTNARVLLQLLGIEVGDEGLCGSMDATETLERIQKVRDRPEAVTEFTRPTEVDKAPGMATLISCGLDSSRIYEYLDGLTEICDEAREAGREVVWC